MRAVSWPAVSPRSVLSRKTVSAWALRVGLTPAALGLWLLHEAIIGGAALVTIPAGSSRALDGIPWFRWDVGYYAAIAAHGYGHLPAYDAAYFPGVPAYLWLTHWPWLSLAVVQVALIVLVVQVGRLAEAMGITGWRVAVAQAFVALAPAAVFYSTAYPELWEALAVCGALLAMRQRRPVQAAAWAMLGGVMDPMGLLIGFGALAWLVWSILQRDGMGVREGLVWGMGSAAALALVAGVLWRNGRPALGFIGAQHAWGAHWVWPTTQVWQALTTRLGPESTTRLETLAVLPLLLVGLGGIAWGATRSRWHAALAAIAFVIAGVALAFFTNREPLSSASRFLSLDIPAFVALAGLVSRRWVPTLTIWVGLWAAAGAVLFAHGWFWG